MHGRSKFETLSLILEHLYYDYQRNISLLFGKGVKDGKLKTNTALANTNIASNTLDFVLVQDAHT